MTVLQLQPMYADQERVSLDRDRSVFEAVAEGNDELMLGTRTVKSRAYLSWFNFKGGSQQKPISALSGGELNRLALAQVVKSGGNLLLGGMYFLSEALSLEYHKIGRKLQSLTIPYITLILYNRRVNE